MAKPDSRPDDFSPGKLRNGFNMIVRDLDRAFAAAGLGTYETFMLQQVREASWTASLWDRRKGDPLPDPLPCRLNLSALADAMDFNRCLLSRAITNLIAYRILDRLDSGEVLINKNYFVWVYPGKDGTPDRPRFTDKQIAFIQDFPGNGTKGKRAPRAAENTTETTTELLPTGSSGCYSGVSAGDTQEYQLAGGVIPVGSSGCYLQVSGGDTQEYQRHIEETGARLESLREIKRGKEGANLPADSSSTKTPVENDPDEVARVGVFAEDALGMIGYARFVIQDAALHKIAYIEEAIREARDAKKTDWRYVRRIFERFTREGESKSEKAAREDAARNASDAASLTYTEITPEVEADWQHTYAATATHYAKLNAERAAKKAARSNP